VIHVHQVTWGPEAVTIAYSEDGAIHDVSGLPVVMTHQLVLPPSEENYEGSELYEVAQDFVRDCLTAYGRAPEWKDPEPEPEDDDDDQG